MKTYSCLFSRTVYGCSVRGEWSKLAVMIMQWHNFTYLIISLPQERSVGHGVGRLHGCRRKHVGAKTNSGVRCIQSRGYFHRNPQPKHAFIPTEVSTAELYIHIFATTACILYRQDYLDMYLVSGGVHEDGHQGISYAPMLVREPVESVHPDHHRACHIHTLAIDMGPPVRGYSRCFYQHACPLK